MAKYQRTKIALIALTGMLLPLPVSIQVARSLPVNCPSITSNRPVYPNGSPPDTATFIDPTTGIPSPGNVCLGQRVYIGPFALLQSSTSASIKIDDESNVQDNVKILASGSGVQIGKRVIMGHGATVKGTANIGIDGTDLAATADTNAKPEVFLSFGSEVDGATLEKNTSVAALGRVGPGVRLRTGKVVLPGKNVTTQQQADNPGLGKVRLLTEVDIAFSEAVIEVNEAFAKGYTSLAQANPANVQGISIDPGFDPKYNPRQEKPTLAGVQTSDPSFKNRIIGYVQMTDSKSQLNTVMGNRISLRADEGEPFTIGKISRMNNDVIFHALEGTNVRVGDNVTYGEGAIVHGGLQTVETGGTVPQTSPTTIIENNVQLKNQSVVFTSNIKRDAVVGVKTAIINSTLEPGTTIGDRIIYLNDRVFGTVEW